MNKQIKVLYFGILRDITSKRSELLEFSTSKTITPCLLFQEFLNKYDEIDQEIKESMVFSVDLQYISIDNDEIDLTKSKEIALLPAISGG